MNQLSILDMPEVKSIRQLNTFGLSHDVISIIESRDKVQLRRLLTQASVTDKGLLFEKVMAYLLELNGYIVELVGASHDMGVDILLYHPDKPDLIASLVQVKNWNRPLDRDDVVVEINKFEDLSKSHYNCRFYEIYSINGFASSAKALSRFNVSMYGWSEIESLIDSIQMKSLKTPSISLRPHNVESYQKLMESLKVNNRACFVQATGTGKSYVFAKYMNNNFEKKGLLVAPSNVILEQFKASFKWRLRNVQMMTYAKLSRLSVQQVQELDLDYILLDEFHRSGAEQWGDGVESLLGVFTDIPVIGASATPVRYLDGGRDMSVELFSGNVSNTIELPDAIARGILNPPKFISALYSIDEDVEVLRKKISESDCLDQTKSEQELILDKYVLDWKKGGGVEHILKKYLSKLNGKVLVFCEDIQHVKEMSLHVSSWFLSAFGDVPKMYTVHSNHSNFDNQAVIKSFINSKSKGYQILFSVDMLNEGLHVSDVEAVILLRKTVSPRIFYQQIGRCIQVDQSFQPVIFDFVNNCQSIKAVDFETGLVEAITRENKCRLDLGMNKKDVHFEVLDYSRDFSELIFDISQNISSWNKNYQLLKEFVAEYDRFPKKTEMYHGVNLGSWVQTQKTNYGKGTLSEKRIQQLEQLGIAWDKREENYQRNYQLLEEFIQEKDRFPKKTEMYHGVNLGAWVNTQRKVYGKGALSEERIQQLEQLGIAWDKREENYQRNYQLLEEFIQEKDRFPKTLEIYRGVNLGSWFNTQKANYDKGALSEERIKILQEIGMVFED